MRTILISHSQNIEFEQKLNEYLKKIESKGQEVVDIKFHMRTYQKDDDHEMFYALIMYDRPKKD
jgi:hypothetical protein